jgi:hypothetical protein
LVQTNFLLHKLVAQMKGDPSLAEKEPYGRSLAGDQGFFRAAAEQDPQPVMSLLGAIGSAWEGATPEEYEEDVAAYFAGVLCSSR